ncbi:AEC family transporter [Halomonas sp. S3-1-8]|uniref:AEC family transporter n=2 Tax=unclassified Halomonas TaxID=2609666 RepID=UPI00299F8FF1|nr:AEC family transporter [Halomonas sp. S3-1-8]
MRALYSRAEKASMLSILAITTPIFLLIGAGYVARRSRLMSAEQMQGVSIFVLYLALPALVIRAFNQQPLGDILQLNYLVAYGLASALVFGLGLLISLRRERENLAAGAMQALGMAAANSGFIGYPVAAMVIGSPAAVLLALNMMVENLLIIPTALVLAEMASQRSGRLATTLKKTALNLVKNPVLVGLAIALSLAGSGLLLPAPLAKAVDMLAEAAGPAALFVIGGALFGLRLKGQTRHVSLIVIGKLLIHPLAVLAAFLVIPGIDPVYIVGAVLFASAPMISIYPLFGQRYGVGDMSAAAMLTATVASFVTLSLIIALLLHTPSLAL